jgi:C4-type Zn-finger protein
MSENVNGFTPRRCPFCDSKEIHITDDRGMIGYSPKHIQVWLYCDDCGARGPYAADAEKAYMGWNGKLEKEKTDGK